MLGIEIRKLWSHTRNPIENQNGSGDFDDIDGIKLVLILLQIFVLMKSFLNFYPY